MKLFIIKFFLLTFLFSCYTSKSSVDRALLLNAMQLANEDKIIKISIIGDSLSEWSGAFGLQNKLGARYQINDYSVAGRNTEDWLYDINTPFQTASDITIIELGTNDAMSISKERFQSNYKQLISKVKERTNSLVIITTVPLSDDLSIKEIIRENNLFLRNLSKDYILADIEKAFLENGTNFQIYSPMDPIHPNPIGYELMGLEYKRVILSIGIPK